MEWLWAGQLVVEKWVHKRRNCCRKGRCKRNHNSSRSLYRNSYRKRFRRRNNHNPCYNRHHTTTRSHYNYRRN